MFGPSLPTDGAVQRHMRSRVTRWHDILVAGGAIAKTRTFSTHTLA